MNRYSRERMEALQAWRDFVNDGRLDLDREKEQALWADIDIASCREIVWLFHRNNRIGYGALALALSSLWIHLFNWLN